MALTYGAARVEPEAEPDGHSASLKKIEKSAIPIEHPVNRFAELYEKYRNGGLLPHEDDIVNDDDMSPLFPWAKQIEPIELEGRIDFKVLRQGSKHAERERRAYKDQWMHQTIDPEFAEARYNEIIASCVLRKPLYSRGATPTRERSFLYLLRGTFPVFSENRAWLRVFLIEAEPYAVS